jgi:hypothetical protein
MRPNCDFPRDLKQAWTRKGRCDHDVGAEETRHLAYLPVSQMLDGNDSRHILEEDLSAFQAIEGDERQLADTSHPDQTVSS